MRLFAVLTLVLIASLSPTSRAAAQEHATGRGSLILGGSGGFTSQRIGDDRASHAFLNPKLQYFVRPGLAIGGVASFSRRSFQEDESLMYGAGPQVSLFAGSLDEKVIPYASARTVFSDASFADNGIVTYGGSAGLLYLINAGVGLDASLFYERTSQLSDPSELGIGDEFGFALGISAFVF